MAKNLKQKEFGYIIDEENRITEQEKAIFEYIFDDEEERILEREGFYSDMTDKELKKRLSELQDLYSKLYHYVCRNYYGENFGKR